METDIQAGILSAVITFILINTNATFEYLDFFKLKVTEEFKTFNAHGGVSFLDFLQIKHCNFLTRLLGCPICLGVWFGFLLNLFGKLCFGGKINLGFGVSIFISWVLYFLLLKITNESNNSRTN